MIIYSQLSDSELLDRLKVGDVKAYKEIYDRFYGILYVNAHKRLKNEDDADDLIQDLFTALWVKRDYIRIEENLSGYLYTSVRNRILDIIAHQKIKDNYVESLQLYIDEKYNYADVKLREDDLKALIEREISALPPRMREVFELSRKHEFTHKEIAAKLRISEHTVRDQVKKALRILRIRLGLIVYIVYLIKFKS